MIFTVGQIDPELTALMDEKLAHGYVGIDFTEIGKKCYSLMHAAAGGEPVPLTTFTPALSCVGSQKSPDFKQ
jgi:hypothetical protein